jgi:hypothetical protein
MTLACPAMVHVNVSRAAGAIQPFKALHPPGQWL